MDVESCEKTPQAGRKGWVVGVVPKTIIKRYSEGFKQQVVREYEAGRSVHELNEKYGVHGGSKIRSWIKKYA